MKLSVFTTITDPDKRGDNAANALHCYSELADEVIVVNGGKAPNDFDADFLNVKVVNHEWPQEFNWAFIGEQFQRGYEAATGDWVIHADLDFIFHESDFARIRRALEEHEDAPAMSFYKWQFMLPDRYNLKSRLVLAVNKKKFGDRIKFNGGGDLCQPTLDGRDMTADDVPASGVAFYNYEKLSKTQEQITDDVERMERAYRRCFNTYLYARRADSAYEGWVKMAQGRFEKPSSNITLNAHPKYMQETIKNLKPNQFGYSGLGKLEPNRYVV